MNKKDTIQGQGGNFTLFTFSTLNTQICFFLSVADRNSPHAVGNYFASYGADNSVVAEDHRHQWQEVCKEED